MKRQDLFNTLMDISNNLNSLYNDSYNKSIYELRETIIKNNEILRDILNDEFGDWGDPKFKLWNNFDKTENDRKTNIKNVKK